MKRARHPLPFELQGIKHDPATGRYFITERGLTYYFTLEHSRLLKQYFRAKDSRGNTVANWFHGLDRFTKKEIQIIGETSVNTFDFPPDQYFED